MMLMVTIILLPSCENIYFDRSELKLNHKNPCTKDIDHQLCNSFPSHDFSRVSMYAGISTSNTTAINGHCSDVDIPGRLHLI